MHHLDGIIHFAVNLRIAASSNFAAGVDRLGREFPLLPPAVELVATLVDDLALLVKVDVSPVPAPIGKDLEWFAQRIHLAMASPACFRP